jgi:positive regulator of sigma E activity
LKPATDLSECMTARGVVCAHHDDGTVEVDIRPAARCAGCAGVCMWGRLPIHARARLQALRPLPAGTPVLVALPQRYVLLSALALHGVLWLALLGGAVAGTFVTRTDAGAVIGAVLAAVFSIIMTPRLRRRLERAAYANLTLLPIA